MSSNVEKIKERLDIVQVVGSYIKLEKAGSNLKARCPFHNEKTPSFFVSPARGGYYCFGCSAKGDIFNFVQEFEGLDFKGALKVLAEKAGVPLEKENPKERNEKDRLFAVMEAATKHFEENLKKESIPKEYLLKRGLEEKTISNWRIGYARNDWQDLYENLLTNGFSASEMEKVGLARKSEKNTAGYFDFFRGRIMFPIFDSAGRVVAFSGRILPSLDDGKTGKYVNSPESELFNKSRILYGYDKAKNQIRVRDYTILVEGQMDLIMCHQAGFTNSVASSGTALTMDQLQILKHMSNNLIMSYDADNAGFRASERAFRLALELGMVVKVVMISDGKDPAELIQKDPDEWTKAVKDSKHVIDFFVDSLMSKGLNGRKLAEEIKNRVLPFVKALESSIEQSHFVGDISIKTGIREESIWEDLKKVKMDDATGDGAENQSIYSSPKAAAKQGRKMSMEKKIFGVIYWMESKENPEIDPKILRTKFSDIVGADHLKEFEKEIVQNKSELLFEAEVFFKDKEQLQDEIDEMFLNLEEDLTKEEFVKAMDELHIAEKAKNKAKISEILEKCQDISKKLTQLSKSKK